MNPFYKQKFKVYGVQDARSEDGGVVYSSYPIVINGKLEVGIKVFKKPNGEEITAEASFFTESQGIIKENWKIEAISDGKIYKVILCENLDNEMGYDHTEAYLQLLNYES